MRRVFCIAWITLQTSWSFASFTLRASCWINSDSMTEERRKAGRGVIASKLIKTAENAVKTPTSYHGKRGRKCSTSAPKITKRKELQRKYRSEIVLIKPAQGLRYAEVLKDLEQNVKPDTLCVKISGVREKRKGKILIEIYPAADGRTKLSSAIRKTIGAGNGVRELVPRKKVEVLDFDTMDA